MEVLPLRLHIDQDALNFLVQFMCFAPATDDGGAGAEAVGGTGDVVQKGPYFKLCVVRPLFARVDTISKHVKLNELIQGNLGELAGLVSLEKAHVVLPEVVVKGAHGTDRLTQLLVAQWASALSEAYCTWLPQPIVYCTKLPRPVYTTHVCGNRNNVSCLIAS